MIQKETKYKLIKIVTGLGKYEIGIFDHLGDAVRAARKKGARGKLEGRTKINGVHVEWLFSGGSSRTGFWIEEINI